MRELLDAFGMRFDGTREMLLLGLILARSLPMIFMTPFLAGQLAPPEIKMAIGVMFALLIWPIAHGSILLIPIYAMPYMMLMFKEIFVGFAIGFASSHVFYAMEVAGRFIDTARGSAMAEVMVPSTRGRATILGNLYQQMLLVFFITLGGHQIFFDTFFESFVKIPLHENIDLTPGFGPMAEYATRLTGDIMLTATILAAPAIAATFITDLVFGILNRVAPQLNAYFMAMPVKAMGALAMIMVALPAFTARLVLYMESSLNAAQQTIIMLMHRT
jgi:flagellar biosynthetic protein FliR